jgi:protein-disulfide isomerase
MLIRQAARRKLPLGIVLLLLLMAGPLSFALLASANSNQAPGLGGSKPASVASWQSLAGPQAPAAEVNGRVITVGELEAFMKDEWFADKTSTANGRRALRTRDIQNMITDRVIRDAAAAAGYTTEQFLFSEANKPSIVTDVDIARFNEVHPTEMSTLEERSPGIRNFLVKQAAANEITEGLRERAEVVIHLELMPPWRPGAQPTASETVADPGPQEPAVEVNGRMIRVGELDAFIKDAWFAELTLKMDPLKIFELRAEAIEGMIDHRVIQDAADAAELSVDEFLNTATAQYASVTGDEIVRYYEKYLVRHSRSATTFEDAAQWIRLRLQVEKGKPALLERLRAEAGAVILLGPVREDVSVIGPSLGPDNARVTIVIFVACPCHRNGSIWLPFKSIRERYPDDVRFVFRQFPQDSMHFRAWAAADATACAGVQGMFGEFFDQLANQSRRLSDEDLEKSASKVGLEMNAFRQCLRGGEGRRIAQADTLEAARIGVPGTFTYFVNGIRVAGFKGLQFSLADPMATFVPLIDAELERVSGM